MDAEDFSRAQTTRKIRVRGSYGGRNRPKPYLRKSKQTKKDQPEEVIEQGFLSKVSSYIVPKWISSWFTGKEKETVEAESSTDEEGSSDQHEPRKTAGVTTSQVTGNTIVSQERALKNLTSTPMIGNSAPFSIIRSEVSDPQEGPSTVSDKKQPTILDGRSLLSVNNFKEDFDFSDRPVSTEAKHESNAPMRYQFNLGSTPSQNPQRFAASRNKPTFKVSSFVSSSPLIPSGSASAFYPGRTSFGGVSSFQNRTIKRQRVSPVAANILTKKANIKPKSLSTARVGAVTSDTARKILGALEKMSSPVHDASKLPSSPSSVLFNPMKRRNDFSFSQSSSKASPRPPTKSLLAPNMFKIQKTSKPEEPNMFTNKFASGEPRPGVTVGTFKTRGLPTSFSPENDNRSSGKMKRQRQTAHYSSAAPEVEEEPVNKLPAIKQSIPLPVTSLPKFDFGAALKSKPLETSTESASLSSPKKSSVPKEQTKSSSNLFKFSEPEKIAKNQGQKSTELTKNTFQFSAPFAKDNDSKENKSQKAVDASPKFSIKASTHNAEKQMVVDCKSNLFTGKATVDSSEKPMKSVWGQPVDQWECGTCMLMNKPNKDSCVACETPRSDKTGTKVNVIKVNSLAEKFKPAPGSWECDTCMVRNKEGSSECVACNAKKPGSKPGAIGFAGSIDKKDTSSNAFAKFAPATGSWECETCMVNNNSDAIACVSCTTPKPGAAAPSVLPSSISFGNTGSAAKPVFGVGSKTSSTNSVTFGSSGGLKFGSSTMPGAVTFGTDPSKAISFGSSGSKGISFGVGDKKESSLKETGRNSFSFGSNAEKATIEKNESGFAVNNSNTKNVMFGNGQTKSNILETKSSESLTKASSNNGSKTEENNNKFTHEENASSGFVAEDKSSGLNIFGAPKTVIPSQPIKDNKTPSFPTIAEAAQSGLLRIPQIQEGAQSTSLEKETVAVKEPPKFSFGAVSNGPLPTAFGLPKVAVTSPEKTESSNTLSSSATKSMPATFSFGASSSSDAKQSKSTGFSFGTANSFTSKPVQALENTSKTPSFSFGNSPAPKSTNLFGGSNASKETLDTKKPFSFGADASKSVSFAPSVLQQKPLENAFKFSNNKEESKPAEHNPTPAASLFGSQDRNQTNFNPVKPEFSSPSLFKNQEASNPSAGNLFGLTNKSVAPAAGFSFGNNLNPASSSDGLFNKPAASNPITNNLSAGGGFNFGGTPSVPDTKLFTESVAQTLSSPANPFSFTASVANQTPASGGFQFGAKSFGAGSNSFGSNQSQAPASQPAGFSFTNSTPAAGGFNFSANANNSSTPTFSSGAPASAVTNRPIKKAVRRRK